MSSNQETAYKIAEMQMFSTVQRICLNLLLDDGVYLSFNDEIFDQFKLGFIDGYVNCIADISNGDLVMSGGKDEE
jgi:hypothetical protein